MKRGYQLEIEHRVACGMLWKEENGVDNDIIIL